jgi:multidrug efflux pump subunit AcrA (membrane-fusion protein)
MAETAQQLELTPDHEKEGDWVGKGDIPATVDARREWAQLALAEARLARVKAGFGAEVAVGQRVSRPSVAAFCARHER